MGQLYRYEQLKLGDLRSLDRHKTIFLMAVSPLEVHGTHLPVGTDVLIAEELQKRYLKELANSYPDFALVILPSLYAGASALPVKGSLSISAPVMEGLIYDTAKGLAEQGFKYLFLSDNHGGPGHQLAIEVAARRVWKNFGFYLINPFGLVFRQMVQHDRDFLNAAGLRLGNCGDDDDSHAGINETSLVLAIDPDLVDPGYLRLPPSICPRYRGVAKAASGTAAFLKRLGFKILARDLEHLAATLAWVNSPDPIPYLGDPVQATPAAGEAMLQARVKVAMGLFTKALRDERIVIKPLLWDLRFIRWFAK